MSLDLVDFITVDPRRFWSFVRCAGGDECWLWKGSRNVAGYGLYYENGKSYYAHHIVWFLSCGAMIESGLVRRHTCDVRHCCNPGHIISGTQADNVRDMFARRRRVNTAAGERHPRAKLTWDDVREMRTRYANGEKIAHIARTFGVSFWAAEAVVKYEHWREKGVLLCP